MISVRADMSGGPRHILTLVNALRALDPGIKLYGAISCSTADELAPLLRMQFHQTVEIPRQQFSIHTLFTLRRFVRENGISIIHSHGFGAGLYSRLIAATFMGSKTPVVVHTFHGLHSAKYGLNMAKNAIQALFRPFTNAFIAVSDEEALFAKRSLIAPANKVVTILNGINLPDKMSPKTTRDHVVAGSLTRLDPIKDPAGLVYQFEEFFNQNPKAALELRLCGVDLDNLPLTSSRIHVFPPTREPHSFLQGLDLYVSHSRSEGLPLAVLEAMANGTPCLLSDIPGHHYFLSRHIALSFELDNKSSFQKALQQLLINAGLRQELAKKAFSYVQKHHSSQAMASHVRALYQTLLHNKTPRTTVRDPSNML